VRQYSTTQSPNHEVLDRLTSGHELSSWHVIWEILIVPPKQQIRHRLLPGNKGRLQSCGLVTCTYTTTRTYIFNCQNQRLPCRIIQFTRAIIDFSSAPVYFAGKGDSSPPHSSFRRLYATLECGATLQGINTSSNANSLCSIGVSLLMRVNIHSMV
jgi:hypothetical protein